MTLHKKTVKEVFANYWRSSDAGVINSFGEDWRKLQKRDCI